MKKQFAYFIVFTVLATSLIGCSSKTSESMPPVEAPLSTSTPVASATPEATTLTASEVFDEITSGIEFPMQTTIDDTMLSDMYGIDVSLLDSYVIKAPMISTHISECAVFKLKDAKDADKIIEGINKRASSVGRMLYPSLEEIYNGRQTATKGNYILFVMDESASTIVDQFNHLVK